MPFLAIGCTVGMVMTFGWPRRVWLTRLWFAALGGLYVVLATPFVATAIAAHLPSVLATPAESRPVATLVVFDGDNRWGRVREAERIYKTDTPRAVWVLGDRWLTRQLIADGMPADRVVRDSATLNTREQIAALGRICAGRDAGGVGLVVSRLQMPRVAALVSAAGLSVALFPSAIDDEPPTTGARRFLPAYIALRVSRDALYEHAALAFYRWRGWIRVQPGT
jgi:uncharacterized SAM-binding protein YcdF (DUF218 family)